jgi:predicted phage baseplate assembly protein
VSDPAPGPPRAGLPALPYRPGDRQQFFAQLLAELARTDTADGEPFGLTTRALDDPTVALLDAWATVADVIAFYQERLANEGFLRTATQPGSLLAIAQLVGYQPRPALAASVWLAYTLHPDPADTAVALPAGLLAQSVPGTGELPQTFETATTLVARPSWNSLSVRTTGPVTAPAGLSALTSLSLAGVTTGLNANDVILLFDGSAAPTPVLVQAISADLAQQVTAVSLQQPLSQPAVNAVAQPAGAAPTGGALPWASQAGTETVIAQAIDALLPGLSDRPATPPVSAAALNRSPAQVFTADSDSVPRLVAALHPTFAATIYKALGTASLGPTAVSAAQALRVQAAPFGVRMPPRPIFDSQGQQVGTEDWPIGDLQVLSAQLNWSDGRPVGAAQVSVQGPGGVGAQAAVDAGEPPPAIPLGHLGRLTIAGGAPASAGLPPSRELTFEPAASSGLVAMSLTLAPQGDGAISVSFGDGTQFVWVPSLQATQRFTLGNQRITVGWSGGGAGGRARADGELLLTVSVAEALPLAAPAVLDLDTTYLGILPGSWVTIQQSGPGGGALPSTSVAQVTNVATVAVARYGMSATVTELTLDRAWTAVDTRWLTAVRGLSVRAQPADLTLLPVALPGPLAGSAIDLAGLYAGIEAGQRILVAGTRGDLPAGATVPAGEAAMVAEVTQQVTGGSPAYTTLQLAAPLAYSYDLASVQVYGNVVPARQGATVTEPLAGSVPGDPHPHFTLSQAPVLADPSATAAGSASSLRLTVDARTWAPVTRLDATTAADSYLTGVDSQGRTTIRLSGPLPTGTSAVVAAYRTGQGSAGNVRAHQVTLLLSRPLAVASVDNPLPASGGADGDGPDDLRAGAPSGLAALGRLVSVTDAADLVASWAGVGKASAVSATDGVTDVVVVTVAGVAPVALDPAGALCTALAGALVAAGDPSTPVVVRPARLFLIVLGAQVHCDPALSWTDISAGLRAALLGAFGYPARQLSADVVISEVVAVAHGVPGVESFSVTAITLVPTDATAGDIQALTSDLPPPPAAGRLPLPAPGPGPVATGGQAPAEAVAFLSDAMTDTLILQQVMR